ncbi:hypothetical protein OEIGOIKO_02245 [Streptomyces chrestomyceticus JCM 4735]|uniref:Uncharacterized protein n=1 Tax=Streptomyces chrestomyceticus JCM 4735 TaxID=1306181 RepID=A0A7U9KSK0_9ACTN|nr:hypothetical protein [Streptomyces chrestomyceticus]GCD34511.1 hypothetical protein OEIGOIKO_02245 [Streptomyces chrestomyceticus JCM 4735]
MTVLPVAVPEPDGYRTQLAALGTKLEYLHPALRAGEVARRSATRNHPANTAGTRAYQEHVRIIREMHIRHEGWKRLLHDHLELVCNPDRTVAFGVMSGDGATGERTFPPRNARRRGAATKRVAEDNAAQLELFPLHRGNEVVLSSEEAGHLQVWFLVSRRIEAGDKVYVHNELSLPAEVVDGYVSEWKRRILLPVFEMDGIEPPHEDGGGEIDIPVPFR